MKLARVLIALAVLFGSLTFAPPAQANINDVYTEYYDCNVAFIGWHWRTCDDEVYYEGTQSGYFKRVDRTRCDGSYSSTTWYQCSGGTCTVMSSPPTPPPPGVVYC